MLISFFQAQPKIFSAGLDIMEMYNPKPERLRAFWRALQDLWIRVYVSRLATVAAINVCCTNFCWFL